jgi:hypothetical protein
MQRHLKWQTGRLDSRAVQADHWQGPEEATGQVLRHRSDTFHSPGQFRLSVLLMSYGCLTMPAGVLCIEFHSRDQQTNPLTLLFLLFGGGLTVGASREIASTGSPS